MTMRFGLMALTVLMLSGCSTSGLLVSTEPQSTLYTLRPAAVQGEASDLTARIVEIAKPSVPPGFETDRIALYTADGQKLDYYAGARWSEILDDVMEDFTRRSASANLPYIVAVTPDQSIDADYRLQVKINDFQPVYGASTASAPVLKVSVEFTLIRLPEEKIVSSFTLSKEQDARSNNLDEIVAGLESLLQELQGRAFTKIDTYIGAKPKN